MMTSPFTLVDPRTGEPNFQLHEFGPGTDYVQWQHRPTYSVLWIQQGEGRYDVALSNASFAVQTLLFFSANQPFRLSFDDNTLVRGVALHFGPDFYSQQKHQVEAACKELLFNLAAAPVTIQVGADDEAAFTGMVAMLREEMQQPALAQREMLFSCLKILLIRASRLRLEQSAEAAAGPARAAVPDVLQRLEKLIEQHYHQKHTPADYAHLLHLSPKSLGKLLRTYYRKTLTALIQERIVIEAKRQLYLTNKSVKEIAFALGFNDQYYFSRFFKHTTSIAPQQYRRAGMESMGAFAG
ncbi:helix-turn-helix domain-containing protein [Hymenobacter terricola]|uniref:helix-turn-helix domain-containing protein n=1 Tax=Hymenobacter terricola TaxID=2819236 RepID=UPI001B3036EC|nr:AraC family transcriptional regulator [Hymenobacter terricola]